MDGLDNGAIVQDQEGGHGANAVLLRHLSLTIDVDFAEGNLIRLGIFGRK